MAALPLETEIRRRIEIAGPMPVGHYMSLCLAHPQHGYYITRDPLGRNGDFTTSPEISQMFGELVGLWAASVWQAMGSPLDFKLVELGPGHGTLMRDALRAAQVVPDFLAAANVHMVEVSPLLARMQHQTLNGFGVPIEWHRCSQGTIRRHRQRVLRRTADLSDGEAGQRLVRARC
jgi:NADH dehydrogenase [ubiquinone] 1 alpha subcomplex assembly factor 7